MVEPQINPIKRKGDSLPSEANFLPTIKKRYKARLIA